MDKLTVSVSPHIHSEESIQGIMLDVVISLFPVILASFILFGEKAILMVSTSVVFCVLTEHFWNKMLKRENSIKDLSAVVTGIIFAFVLPPDLPIWIVAIGAVLSILIGKLVFGGLGYNIFNPALVGRAILLASWPVYMTTWVKPFEGVTTATPLAIAKLNLNVSLPSYLSLFLGNRAGSLGETSVLALMIGAVYLLIKKRISFHTPVSFIGMVFLLSLLFGKDPLFQIMAGGLILGAFFMATDMVTSPITNKGKIIFGMGAGTLTFLIRTTGGFPEGVCYSILIMNMFTPLIDYYIKPKPFGAISENSV